jgi:hypothetical protein
LKQACAFKEKNVSLFRPAILAALAAALLNFAHAAETPPKSHLARFESEGELRDWLASLKKRLLTEQQAARAQTLQSANSPAAPAMAAAPPAAKEESKDKMAADSVTNVQTAGVDEGGIVKVHGDHLVVLRRGRLFTVSLREGGLSASSMADAYGSGIDPGGAWYDEMLIRGDTVIVIGYSYARGGSEIGLFDLDGAGRLTHRATYHLRSNDYYSSRNYASRLIGDKLIFYTPLYLNLYGDPFASFPALRRWQANAGRGRFQAHRARHAHLPDRRGDRAARPHAPHRHGLRSREEGDGVRSDRRSRSRGACLLRLRRIGVRVDIAVLAQRLTHLVGGLRIPLDGRAPTGAQDERRARSTRCPSSKARMGHLNVLLRAARAGRGDVGIRVVFRSTALLRVALDAFGDGKSSAPAPRTAASLGERLQRAEPLRRPVPALWERQTWGAPNAPRANGLHVVRWAERGTAQTLSIPHGVDRIEAMGTACRRRRHRQARTCISPACASRQKPRFRIASRARTPRRAKRAATVSSTRPIPKRRASWGSPSSAVDARATSSCARARRP